MNDIYVECLVSRKKNPIAPVLKYVVYGLAIACAAWAFLGWIVLFVPAIVLAGVGYYVLPMMDVEYEYLYLEKEISIDKVISKERRKHAETIDLNKAELIAPSNSHELDSYKARQHKDKDYSSAEENAKTYTICVDTSNGLELIKFEPNEEIIKAIKTVFPRKIKEY